MQAGALRPHLQLHCQLLPGHHMCS
jgi:hypothetical protein